MINTTSIGSIEHIERNARVPPIEDDGPNVGYHCMSFTYAAHLAPTTSAIAKLMRAVPNRNHTADCPFSGLCALSNYWCRDVYELADVLHIMHAHGVSQREHVRPLSVSMCHVVTLLLVRGQCHRYGRRILHSNTKCSMQVETFLTRLSFDYSPGQLH